MSNVVDSLVVTLGLDSAGFRKGQKESARAMKETQATVKSAAAEMSGALRRVGLEFAGLFFGIRGLEDLVRMFANLSSELWHLGINARNLGVATNELRDWQEVAELAGGKAEDATAAVNGLQKAIFNLRFRGQVGDQIEGLQRLGINPMGPGGRARDIGSILTQASGALQSRFPDQATRYQYATNYLGLQGGIANAVASGPKALAEFYERAKQATQITEKQTDAQGQLNDSVIALRYNIAGAAAEILDNVTPALKSLAENLNVVVGPIKWLADLLGGGKTGVPLLDYKLSVPGAMGDAPSSMQWFWGKVGGGVSQAGHGLRNSLSGVWDKAMEARDRQRLSDKFSAIEQDMGLPAGLLDRIATAESRYDASQVGSKGELGLFQLMPQFHPGAGQDPILDAQMAAGDLRDNYRQLGNWPAAVAAYNEGVEGYKRGAVPNGNAAYVNRVLGANPQALGVARGAQPTPSLNSPPIASNGARGGGVTVDIGSMTVNTQARDASGIAADLASAVRRKFMVFQADGGMVS